MAVASSTAIFFTEKAEFTAKLGLVLETRDAELAGPLCKRLADIIGNYQEQPHLLDPHLDGIITPVMGVVRSLLRSWYADRQAGVAAAVEAGLPASAASLYELHTDPYLACLMRLVYTLCKTRGYKTVTKFFPHEVADLEPALTSLLCQNATDHATWDVRYILLLWLSILVLLPFDLRTIDSTSSSSGGGGIIATLVTTCATYLSDPGTVRTAAAVCLSRLLSRPDLDSRHLRAFFDWTVDALAFCCCGTPLPRSSGGEEEQGACNEGDEGDDAAAASSSVAARTAATASLVSGLRLRDHLSQLSLSELAASQRSFLATGLLQALVEVSKHGHRESLIGHLADTLDRVLAIASGAVGGSAGGGGGSVDDDGAGEDEDDDELDGGGGGGRRGGSAASSGVGGSSAGGAAGASTAGGGAAAATSLRSSPLMRKLVVKLAARTGLTYLPPRVVAWRYNRGKRSLLENLSAAGVAAATAAVASSSSSSSSAPQADENDDDDEDAEVPAATEDILDQLLSGLRDSDTVVRWSAAKGIGRLTGRLPRAYADDVVAAVLDVLDPTDGEAAWHGGCLALAELARRGLLLPARLPEAVPKVLTALAYDVRKGSHSVGQHVRDAACYACWSFARAYAPEVMAPYVTSLAQGMLITALFDREVNCRRAASAAFQENVGRQGHANFPDGIAILTAADYFSLGNRSNAYLVVAPQVAAFPQYRAALLAHVLEVKLRHWDAEVRALAAQALGILAKLDIAWALDVALPSLLPATCSPDLFVRHGAILGVADLVLALAACGTPLPTALQDEVRNVVVKAERARAYTGRGGEAVRAAMCRLIEAQCVAGHALSPKAVTRLLQTVDECLRHPNDAIQAAALAALRALVAHAVTTPEPALVDRLTRTYVDRLNTEDNPAVRRGAALALGALPRHLLCEPEAADGGLLASVIAALITASRQEKLAVRRDAETRRNAVMALADVVATVGFGPREAVLAPGFASSGWFNAASEALPGLSPSAFSQVWGALVSASHDYATDNRGDVGSWVRKAALEALERVTGLIVEAEWRRARLAHLAGVIAAGTTAGAEAAAVAAAVGARCESASLATPRLTTLALRSSAAGAAPPTVGASGSFSAGITGYGAGTRLVASADWGVPWAAVTKPLKTACGVLQFHLGQTVAAVAPALGAGEGNALPSAVAPAFGVVVGILAGGALVSLAPLAPSADAPAAAAAASTYRAGDLRPLRVVPDCSSCEATPTEVRLSSSHHVVSALLASSPPLTVSCPALCADPVALWGVTSPAALPFPLPADAAPFLTPEALADGFGCFLRALTEKLDLLRAVAGEALCRLCHPPAGPSTLPPVIRLLPDADTLAVVFPPAGANAEDTAALSSGSWTRPLLGPWSGVAVAGATSGEADEGVEDAEEEEGGATPSSPAAGVPDLSSPAAASGSGPSGVIQWGVPNQCFGRAVRLLALPGCVAPLVEGLVTSVGGLSESVVRHSGAAVTAWVSAAQREGRVSDVRRVGNALLRLLKPRRKQAWDELVDGPSSAAATTASTSAGGGYYIPPSSSSTAPSRSDPAMERWFKQILGAASGSGGGGNSANAAALSAATHKVDTRVVTPVLRTLDALLTAGCLDCLSADPTPEEVAGAGEGVPAIDATTFPVAVTAAVRRRMETSKDDAVRVMAASAVLLGFLHLEAPAVRSGVVHGLLDALCHPFPRVRKVVAEKLYVRLLTLEDAFAGGAGAGGVETALALLTETPWASLTVSAELVATRDRLYGLLGVDVPEKRSGVEAVVAGGASEGGAGGAAAPAASASPAFDPYGLNDPDLEGLDGYGALVRESGY